MDEPQTPAVSEAALSRAAQALVAAAVSSTFSEDPVIGPELSRAISVLGSVVKRHGLLLQRVLGDALLATGRFDVLTDVALPVTSAAAELLAAKNSPADLARIAIRADAAADRIATLDLIVIDPDARWAGAYDVKRGNGSIDSRSRRPLEHDLRASRLILASYLAKRGYPGIENVTTGVIDYYGATGFSQELKITREELDRHFDVPVRATLDMATDCLRSALHDELPRLFGNALDAIRLKETERDAVSPRSGTMRQSPASNDAISEIINALPTGPRQRRSAEVRVAGAA
jgi:hypothetical protein